MGSAEINSEMKKVEEKKSWDCEAFKNQLEKV